MTTLNKKNSWGGARAGAGRKAGVSTTKNTCVFYAKCTEEEKTKLSEFLKQLRTTTVCIFLFMLLFAQPSFAKEKLNVILPSNLPKEISVQSIQTTKEHIIFNLKNTSNTSFSFVLSEAVFVDSNGNSHKLMSKMGLLNFAENKPIPDKTIFADGLNVQFEVFPLENNRVRKGYKQFEEKGIVDIFPYYAYQTALFGNDSPIQNKDFALIIPCKNNKDFSTQNLVFKFQPAERL